ncbi:TOMM precursor leader peptide-binding protein [Streptomyces sp. NPDC048659]|uniref:TOMM precursor leader peptide-binding protein n=1 Tax=Streptomyces sp. NPDC048659 TaxID=3155489 RepID=UPI003431A719
MTLTTKTPAGTETRTAPSAVAQASADGGEAAAAADGAAVALDAPVVADLARARLARVLRDWAAAQDTVTALVGFDAAPAAEAGRLDALARDAGRHTLAARLIGDVLQLGPLLPPGGRGCLLCADSRHRAVLDDTGLDPAATEAGPEIADDLGRALPGAHWLPALPALLTELGRRTHGCDEATGRPILCIDLVSATLTWHRLTPVVGCRGCDDTAADPQPGPFVHRPMNAPGSLRCQDVPDGEHLERLLVDHRFGPMRRAYRDAFAPGALVGVEVALPRVHRRLWGYGRGDDHAGARTVGLLEAVERESGCRPQRRHDKVTASYSELGDRALDPALLGLPDAGYEDHPASILDPYRPDTVTTWVPAWSHAEQRHLLVPEHVAHYGVPSRPDRAMFVYECSNGCAVGANREEATLHAALEVLERDAFLLRWYAREAAPPIAPGTLTDPTALLFRQRAQAEGYTVHLFDATTDTGVPVVQALAVAPDRPDAASFSAAGAHFDPQRAVRAALLEVVVMILLQGRRPGVDRDRRLAMLQDPTLVEDMEDHVALYTLPESLHRFDYLLESGLPATDLSAHRERWERIRRSDDLTGLLTEVLDAMTAAGVPPVVVDLTSRRDAALGLATVKLVAPGAVPVTFGHVHHRTTGLPRLDRARARTGHRGAPLPHPFP